MLENIAEYYENVSFFVSYTTDPNQTKLVVYKKQLKYTIEGEELTSTYAEKKWMRSSIEKMINDADHRLILSDFAPDPSMDKTTILFIDLPKENEDYQKYADIIQPYAEKYKDKMKVSFLSEEEKGMVHKTMGVKNDDGGILLFDFISPLLKKDTVPMYKYKTSLPKTSDDVKNFLSDFEEGKLPLYIKSLPEPKQEGLVLEIVATTAKNIILDASHYVLVMYYAPWCPHCKKMFPTWDELAKRVKKFDKKNRIIIARMDADNNDVFDHASIKGFPTIVAYPRGTDKIRRKGIYQGNKSLDDLIDYVTSTYDAEEHEEL